MWSHLDIKKGKIILQARSRVGGRREDAARLPQPSGASGSKRRHGNGFSQTRAVLLDTGPTLRDRRLAAIAAAAVDERHARAYPRIVVDDDVVGNAQRSDRIDDSRIEVQKMM